jgi:hypothetical protein
VTCLDRPATTLTEAARKWRLSAQERSKGWFVPKSRVRKTEVFTPPPKRSAKKQVSPRWLAPTMVGFMIAGVIWLVLGYISNYASPGMSALGGQGGNLIEGFVLLVIGLGLATQWK